MAYQRSPHARCFLSTQMGRKKQPNQCGVLVAEGWVLHFTGVWVAGSRRVHSLAYNPHTNHKHLSLSALRVRKTTTPTRLKSFVLSRGLPTRTTYSPTDRDAKPATPTMSITGCLGPVYWAEMSGGFRGGVLGQEKWHAQRAITSRNKASGGRGRRALERKAAC